MSSLVLNLGISSIPVEDQGVRGEFAKLLKQAGLEKEAETWSRCNKEVLPFKCLDCNRIFYVPNRCDLRICPDCNERYAQKFKARYGPVIKRMLGKKGKNRPMLVTVTTTNKGTIPTGDEIKAHNKAIGKLIRKFFRGGVSVNEVKGTFLHSHIIADGPYTPQKKLSEEWKRLTGDKVVDIREIKRNTRDVINYICKYLKKPYPYEDTKEGCSLAIEFLKSFKGVRRVHSFGIFYNTPPPKREKWACPYCESTNVKSVLYSPSWYVPGSTWTVEECEKLGIKSYSEVLRAWAAAQANRYGYA